MFEKHYLGTVGFGYKDWQKVFYPASLNSREYLKFYSQVFNSVEIDTSFYGCPRIEQIKNWAAMVPEDFKFCFKTPRQITHEKLLHNAFYEMQEFTRALQSISAYLGPVLIQLPPNFDTSEFNALKEFVQNLPSEQMKFAIEFRHNSWFAEQPSLFTRLLLKKHKVAWVTNDFPSLAKRVNNTADFIYMRFIGKHNAYPVKDRERIDVTEKLKWWHSELESSLATTDNTATVQLYGFMNNDYSGHSPATCNKFKKILNLDCVDPAAANLPEQKSASAQLSLF